MAKIAVFAVAFLAICRAQAPQQARVQGQVTSVTGEPIKSARVRLLPLNQIANGAQPAVINTYNTTSDGVGNFEFDSAVPGEYQISAEHNGYLRGLGGSAISLSITLRAGQRVTGVSLELTPESRIEGTITNQDGDPVPEARVFVLRWNAQHGFKQLVMEGRPSQPGAADGTFVIGELTEGHYYVCAEVERGGNDQPRGRSAHETYLTTYYPGVPDVSSATLIKVVGGTVIRGVNIQMKRGAVYRFRGTAINGLTNAPAAGMSVSLLRGSLRFIQPKATVTQDDGSFELNGLAPGEYTVSAASQFRAPPSDGRSADARSSIARPTQLVSSQPITIGNKDVEDGILRLAPLTEVDGTVAVEGNFAQPTQANLNFRVSLFSASPFRLLQGQSRNGSNFLIRDVGPGRYLPDVAGLMPGMYVKAVRLGNQDVTDKAIDFTSGVGGTLEIVISPHAANVSGVVRDSKGNPMLQIQVSLWKPGQKSAGGTFFPRQTLTVQGGAFHFDNLPPGEYRVAAWGGYGAIFANEFLSQFDDSAAVVKLDEDSHQAVEAPLIKQDAIDFSIANLR